MVHTRMKLGKYEAWIVVEEEKVEHYDIDADEENNIATCWIASTAGKHFGVRVVKRHSRFACEADMYLDGSRIGGRLLFKDDKEPALMNKVDVEENAFRRFLFGALNLTDDESILKTGSYDRLGEIKVVIYRITNRKVFRGLLSRPRLPENVQIHERAKKCATHQVLFGELQTQTAPKKETRYTTERKEIVATFIFNYQSLDMLMANEIAPCDPPPVETEVPSKPGPIRARKRKVYMTPEEDEKPVLEISDAEDDIHKEYKRKEAQLEAELEKVRQARLEHQKGKHITKKVKRESKPVFLPGEIIDLTI